MYIRYLFFILVLFLGLVSKSEAKLRQYINPYDISEIEWQVLNWTAAWRGTTTPADPFVLERIEYDRKESKVNVYLKGKTEDATEENLKKSIDGISRMFKKRFPDFDMGRDLIVHYELHSEKEDKYIEYKGGDFK